MKLTEFNDTMKITFSGKQLLIKLLRIEYFY